MLSGPGQFAENETNEVGFLRKLQVNLFPGELQGDPQPCFAEGLHVLHIQNQVSLIRCGISWQCILWHALFILGISSGNFRYTNSSTEIPEFPIPPEIALELLMAANFLDC